MGRNYAITIGINGYSYLQRLNYAKSDADAVRQLFLQELGFQKVYHFTDDSPDIPQDYGPDLESRPTATTLGRFLRKRFDKPLLRDGDNLWFFFAGHGIRSQNRDFLMPIDGDPGDLERSAIPIHYISERLRRSGADNVILLIDACRSFEGKRDGYGIGTEKQQGVITLFSCSPEESSYEIEELQGGAFTHVLLESLRRQGEGNCATVERLYQQLRHYVPQITRQHKRVAQTPYGVIEPPTKIHLILLPQSATLADIATLKNDALNAEVQKDYKLAKQYWVRVLAASPADPNAIEGIERLSRLGITAKPTPVPPPPPETSSQSTPRSDAAPPVASSPQRDISPQPQPFAPGPRTSSRRQSPSLPQRPISRRRTIQVLGVWGSGLGALLLGWALRREPPNNGGNAGNDGDAITTAPPLIAGDFTSFEFEVVTVNETGIEVNRETKQAQVFREAIGEVALELVAIPGGPLIMGSPREELPRDENEGPQRNVTVPQFLIGKYQVTQAQWKAVAALPKVDHDLEAAPARFQGDNRPVEQVSWDDAFEFCQRLSKQTGREYRLPSEAEWEYACRAGETTPFHCGPTITEKLANYHVTESYGSGPKGVDWKGQTIDVGSFPANAFGLYNMHGNVREWCLDIWHDSYEDEDMPTNGSPWMTGGDEFIRVRRGGSWDSNPRICRSAHRRGAARDHTHYSLGFRVVCASPWSLA